MVFVYCFRLNMHNLSKTMIMKLTDYYPLIFHTKDYYPSNIVSEELKRINVVIIID